MKPEEDVIRKCLDEFYAALMLDSEDVESDAERVWASLVDYWMNRGKDKPVDEQEKLTSGLRGDFSEQFLDGTTPYIHGGSARTYDWPLPEPSTAGEDILPNKSSDDWEDDTSDYRDYIMRRLDSIYEELYDMNALPMFTKKEKEKLDKIALRIGRLQMKYYNRNK